MAFAKRTSIAVIHKPLCITCVKFVENLRQPLSDRVELVDGVMHNHMIEQRHKKVSWSSYGRLKVLIENYVINRGLLRSSIDFQNPNVSVTVDSVIVSQLPDAREPALQQLRRRFRQMSHFPQLRSDPFGGQ